MVLERIANATASYAVQGAQTTLDVLKNTMPGALVVDAFSSYCFADTIARKGIKSKENLTNVASFFLLSLLVRTGGGSTPVTGQMLQAALLQTVWKIADGAIFSWAFTSNKVRSIKERKLANDDYVHPKAFIKISPDDGWAKDNIKPVDVSTWGFQNKGYFKLLFGIAYFGLRGADICMFARSGQGLSQFLKSVPGIGRFV